MVPFSRASLEPPSVVYLDDGNQNYLVKKKTEDKWIDNIVLKDHFSLVNLWKENLFPLCHGSQNLKKDIIGIISE